MGNGSGYCLCALLISNDGLRKAEAAQGLALLLKVKSEQSKRVERMEGKSSFLGLSLSIGSWPPRNCFWHARARRLTG